MTLGTRKILNMGRDFTCPLNIALRTVPIKYKGICARLGPRGKSRSLQGLLESTKKKRGSHAFFRDN